jgi:hypothetical protein
MGRAWIVALVSIAAAAALASAAGAGQVERFTVHHPYAFDDPEFCGHDLSVQIAGVIDIRGQIVPHGRDGLAYYLSHGTQFETLSANGTTLTSLAKVNEKDLRVTELDGGWVEVLIVATGNATLYDEAGRAIARNPGQTRLVLVFDENGQEVSREVVKGSTGRSDDFCDAAVAALT